MTVKPKPGVGNYWPTVYAIKDRLREIFEYRNLDLKNQVGNRPTPSNAIHSERATGKTTALVQFVAERTLILPYSDENKIGVVAPNNEIARRFVEQFEENFPTLRSPLVFTAGTNSSDFDIQLRGNKIHEVYAEEIFLIPYHRIREIADHFKFIAGVGTLQSIVSLNIKTW